jgi:hypothetical protein
VAPDAEKPVSDALKLPAEERAAVVDRLLKKDEDEDRELLHPAIARSEEQFLAGPTMPAKAVLDALSKRR